MYVQLADAPQKVRVSVKAASRDNNPENFPFVYIPQERMYIREDYLDDLDNEEWREMMAQIVSYQPQVENGSMSEAQYLCDRASRKKKREERKKDNKAEKKQKADDKHNKKDARTEIKKAKAKNKAEGGGAKGILSSVVEGVKSFMGKGEDGEGGAAAGAGSGAGGGGGEPDDDVPFYKTTTGMIVIGVSAAAAIGGTIYLATRK